MEMTSENFPAQQTYISRVEGPCRYQQNKQKKDPHQGPGTQRHLIQGEMKGYQKHQRDPRAPRLTVREGPHS